MMRTGEKIRDYVLKSRIGAGGVGEVWRAHHERLDKPVAIKRILPHLCRDENIYNRFVQEAIATANLEHPHIVRIHDFFSDDENAYLVMSYIEGGSLQDRLKSDNRLSLSEALHISRNVLDALDFAHQRGVVHRDVKPSNILVTPNLHAYLVDFGIALVLGKTRVTKFGTNVGTPEYMSPEQIRGENLDHHTDVYSFGCVLYEMLAGRGPFGISEEEGTTDFMIMQRHIKDRPKLLRELNSEVDEQTESAVMRALAKDRIDRFAGCAEMQAALTTPAQVRVGGHERQPIKTLRKLKIAVGVMVLSILIVAIGWIYTYRSLHQASSAPHQSRLAVESLGEKLLKVTKARDEAEDQAKRNRQQLASTTAQLQQAKDEVKRYLYDVEQLRDELNSAKKERDVARKEINEFKSRESGLKNQLNSKEKLKKLLNRQD